MNYSEALSFTFQDEEWLKKIAIGGLIAFVSFYVGLFFIFGFFLVGYYLGVLRNVMRGDEKPLPDWGDMGKIFVDGMLGAIIALFYFIIIGGLCAILIVNVANDFMPDYEKAFLIVFISLGTLLAMAFFINFGLIQFAATENFGAAFSLSAMIKLLRGNLGNFLAIVVFSLILNGILFLAGLGILSPFTNQWGMVVQAHLFGQCAREAYAEMMAVQSA